MKRVFNYSKEDMLKAIEACKAGYQSVRKVAKALNVPKSTLQNQLDCKVPAVSKKDPIKVPTAAEEQKFVKCIVASTKADIPAKRGLLMDSVDEILKDNDRLTPFHNGCPGKHWFESFRKRPEVIVALNN